MMRECLYLLTVAVAALAQPASVTPGARPGATVPAGVSLRVALERRVRIKHVGEPIQGRLVEPPDQDIAGRAESGAVGLGLIGTLLAQTSRALASGIAFAGAGFSVYSTFLARGEDVVLPANTPLKVSLKARGGEAQRVRRGLH
jgi:hypothetical protein